MHYRSLSEVGRYSFASSLSLVALSTSTAAVAAASRSEIDGLDSGDRPGDTAVTLPLLVRVCPEPGESVDETVLVVSELSLLAAEDMEGRLVWPENFSDISDDVASDNAL